LQAAATEADQAELRMVQNGREAAMKAYNTAANKKNKEAWDAAREAYEETVDRLVARYFPEEAPEPVGERFKSRKQALDWLRTQGYKVCQGKFYQDIRKNNFPALHRDGSVSRFQVMQYGQRLDPAQQAPVADPDQGARKEWLEIRKLELEIEKRETENRREDERWLLKDDAWAAIAALIGTLLDSLRHHFYSSQGRLIHLAAGDVARSAELYEGCEGVIHKAFNEVAVQRIEGIFAQENEEAV